MISGVRKSTEFNYEYELTKGTSEWEGWGTALKPAHEPICMARKPLAEKTVAENCLKYGTGGINIDESRVDYNGETPNIGGRANHTRGDGYGFKELGDKIEANTQGRFPANLIHDNSEEVRECFPETSTHAGKTRKDWSGNTVSRGEWSDKNDSGSASRFFKSIVYTAKASKAERNKGCEGLEEKYTTDQNKWTENDYRKGGGEKTVNPTKNNHPTVKPIALMSYLAKMVTPKGGVVLDPFMGSGSTGVACRDEGFDFIGIEREEEYMKIAEARINNKMFENEIEIVDDRLEEENKSQMEFEL